jgi:hypothetical protein
VEGGVWEERHGASFLVIQQVRAVYFRDEERTSEELHV